MQGVGDPQYTAGRVELSTSRELNTSNLGGANVQGTGDEWWLRWTN